MKEQSLYEAIFNHIKSPVVIAGKEGIIDMNIAFLELCGFEEKTALCADSYYTNIVNQVISSGAPVFRDFLNKEGILLQAEFRPSLLDQTKEIYLLEVRQLIEESLYDEMSIKSTYNRELFSSFPDPIVILDNKGLIIDVNKSFEGVFGFTRIEVMGRDIDELIVPDTQIETAKTLFRKVLDQERVETAVQRKTKTGELLDFRATAYPVLIDHNIAGNYVLYRDISREKKTERLLKEREEFLEQLFNRSLYPIAILDQDQRVLNINHEFERLFAYSRTELIGKCIDDFIIPEGYENESEEFKMHVFDKKSMAAKTRRKNGRGELIDVEAVGSPVIIQGEVAGMFAMYRDRRLEEQALRDLHIEKAYFKQLFDNTPNPIAVIDRECRVKDINAPFEALFGYSLEESRQKKLNTLLRPTEDKDKTEVLYRQVIRQGKILQFESIQKSKFDSTLEVEVIAFPILLSEGLIEGAYIILQDISERKERERKIESLLYTDTLTGLYNRKYAYEKINKILSADRSLSVIYMDLDKFKEINDSKGHHVGDEVLRGFSNRMRQHFRHVMDICRIGGDEFLAILPASDTAQLENYSQEIQELFEEPLIIEGDIIQVLMSIGVASVPEDGTNIDKVILQADSRMYAEKKLKRIMANPVRTQVPVEELLKVKNTHSDKS